MSETIVFKDNSLVKLLKATLLQKNMKTEDIVQRAVRLSFSSDGSVYVYFTDRLVYSVAKVISDSSIERDIVVDLETLLKFMRFSSGPATFFFDKSNLYGLLAEGTIFIPQYRVSPQLFEYSIVESPVQEQCRMLKKDIIKAIKTVKKTITSASLPELKMLYGTSDGVYGCNGTSVIRNKTGFINTAIRLKDLMLVQEILGESEEPVGFRLFADRLEVLSPYQKIILPKRDLTLSYQYIRAVQSLENYFEVNTVRMYQLLNLFSTLPNDSGYILLSIKEINKVKTLVGLVTTSRGELSSVILSENIHGTLGTGGFKVNTKMLADVVYGFLNENNEPMKIAIQHDMLCMENSTTQATVVTSAAV